MAILNFFKKNKVRTRIAPSPTGPFHIGTARVALFNELFAKKSGGKFILRIEDTDAERSDKRFEEDVISGLKWLNINFDEFYRQSERIKIYKKYIRRMLKEGKAFYCYHALKDLEEEKERQMKNKEAPRHVCWHKNKKTEPNRKNLPAGRQGVIRLKGSSKKIKFHDIIRGEIEIDAGTLGDMAIAKSENEALYNLACVIDDREMNITHVIRGEDHISNTPKQILIHEALKIKTPFYAHLPLILGSDRSKLSKRHGATSVNEYKKMGYLPEAIVNFMTFLGWNPGDDREVFTKKNLINAFSLEKVQKAGAVFNIEKLDWYNREYIRTMPEEKLSKELAGFLPEAWLEKIKKEPQLWRKVTELERSRLTKLSEITEGTAFFFEKPAYEKTLLVWKEESYENTKEHIDILIKLLSDLKPVEFRPENVKNAAWKYAEEKGKGNVLWPFRVALTGLPKSPDPFSVAGVLGQNETLARLKRAREIISG